MERIELQRLIDNELESDQRHRLLLQMENEPGQWRALALALLEEQSFQREIARCSSDSSLLGEAVSTAPVAVASMSNPAQSDTARHHADWVRLALAACLLVAVGYGTGYGLRSRSLIDNAPTVSELASDTHPKLLQDIPSPSSNLDWPKEIGEVQFVSNDESGESTSSIANRVPLFEVKPDHIRHMMEQQARQVQEWNQTLRRRGLEVEWQPEILESQLPDGRAVIVPVNQWNVRPIGQ